MYFDIKPPSSKYLLIDYVINKLISSKRLPRDISNFNHSLGKCEQNDMSI